MSDFVEVNVRTFEFSVNYLGTQQKIWGVVIENLNFFTCKILNLIYNLDTLTRIAFDASQKNYYNNNLHRNYSSTKRNHLHEKFNFN